MSGAEYRVFSYGTLRRVEVQESLYGRVVRTVPDVLPGFRIEWLTITDPTVVALSGSDRHPILRRGDDGDEVEGACLELTASELVITDEYEVDDYTRHEVTLASGTTAWVYLGG